MPPISPEYECVAKQWKYYSIVQVSLHVHAKKPPSANAAINQLTAAAEGEVGSCWMFAGCYILCLWQQTKRSTETQQAFLAWVQALEWSYKFGCSQLLLISGTQGRNQSGLQFGLSYLFSHSWTKTGIILSSLSLATCPALIMCFPPPYKYIYMSLLKHSNLCIISIEMISKSTWKSHFLYPLLVITV